MHKPLGISPMVIVHRTNSGNENLRTKSPLDLNGDKLKDNEVIGLHAIHLSLSLAAQNFHVL